MHRAMPASFAAVLCLAAVFAGALAPRPALAEDGYDLWLRYAPLAPAESARVAENLKSIVAPRERSPTLAAAVAELERGLSGLLGAPVRSSAGTPERGAVVLGTPQSMPSIASLELPLAELGDEGYVIRAATLGRERVTVIAANSDIGVLYGAFALLKHVQTGESLRDVDIASAPQVQLRLLNHWDNLDRSVERGYAGRSLWDWYTLPEYRNPRYTDYARANASIGINGTVLNNVNSKADSLTAPYIEKAAALAEEFRPYGLRVYLSARFNAPIELGGLRTGDPLDPAVRAWWRAKIDEIYAAIPDFGGFLVKANSEGQPGPQDYGRTHADGANMLAEPLALHGGVVLWRAFVYQDTNPEDRAKQAYSEFVPLDGQFADNVVVQVKNGPIDFQPREPFHPLFGAMPETPLGMEFQVTKEYLGFASHLVYLAPMWVEVLDADTYVEGSGSTVARVIDGSLHGHALTAMAGVANTGTDRDWSGSTFNQANWYAYGRLAWDPDLGAEEIAREWLELTFTRDARFVDTAAQMMLESREAPVDYMTPLGLTHLMATGHHYGPGPWVSNLSRPEWNPFYYHRADAQRIGFDRTERGSDALVQYAEPVADRFASLDTVPENLLLWFHRVAWDYEMRSGKTLWDELVRRYDRGVAAVGAMQDTWAGLERFVDTERFAKTAQLLEVQEREARWWRDASIAYWQSISGLPLPAGVAAPELSLAEYRAVDHPYAPH
jgi:alpha-glucuronidase